MPQKSGGLRVGLVYKTYESYLYAMSGEDFQNAGNLLKALSRLVGVQIEPVPANRIIFISDAIAWRDYCEKNLDLVMIGVDKYLKKSGNVRNPFRLVRKGEPQEDIEE